MANENRAIPRQKLLDTELWYLEMYTESGYNSFIRPCTVDDSQLWLRVPREPMVIHIERPLVAGDAKDDKASTSVNPGTEARLSPAGRPRKRRRTSDEHPAFEWSYTGNDKHLSYHVAQLENGGEVYNSIRDAFKMNDPTGPPQRMSKVGHPLSATTNYIPFGKSYKDLVSEKTQLIEDNNRPTEPVQRANASGPNGTLWPICGHRATLRRPQ